MYLILGFNPSLIGFRIMIPRAPRGPMHLVRRIYSILRIAISITALLARYNSEPSSLDAENTSRHVLPCYTFCSSISLTNVNGFQFNRQVPKGCIAQCPDKRRLGSALRFILLILAGDVELNPGPFQIDLQCVDCGEECNSDCICCDVCSKWTHFKCSNCPTRILKEADKYVNFAYFCQNCVDRKMQDKLRAMSSKISSRGIALGTLLDVYDKQTTTTTLAGASPTVDALPPSPGVGQIQQLPSGLESQSEQQPSPTPIIVKGHKDPLSNFYCFNFNIGGVRYRSLEHAYQSMKAKLLGMHSLAHQIRISHLPQEAKWLSKRIPRIATGRLTKLMTYLLRLKIEQCYSFRAALRTKQPAFTTQRTRITMSFGAPD